MQKCLPRTPRRVFVCSSSTEQGLSRCGAAVPLSTSDWRFQSGPWTRLERFPGPHCPSSLSQRTRPARGDPSLDSCHSVLHISTSLNSASSLSTPGFAQAVLSAWGALLTPHLGNVKGFLSLSEESPPLETLVDKARPPLPHRIWHVVCSINRCWTGVKISHVAHTCMSGRVTPPCMMLPWRNGLVSRLQCFHPLASTCPMTPKLWISGSPGVISTGPAAALCTPQSNPFSKIWIKLI